MLTINREYIWNFISPNAGSTW